MHTTHDFIQEAETILFHKESNTVQGISCLLYVNTPVQTFLLISSHKNVVSGSLCFARSVVYLTKFLAFQSLRCRRESMGGVSVDSVQHSGHVAFNEGQSCILRIPKHIHIFSNSNIVNIQGWYIPWVVYFVINPMDVSSLSVKWTNWSR